MADACKHKCRNKTTCRHLCCKRLSAVGPISAGPAPAAIPALIAPAAIPATARGASGEYVAPGRYLYEWPGFDAVVAANELLEGILVFLEPFDLYRYRQVCKHWRAVVDNRRSPRMRRAKFLDPEVDPAAIDVLPNTALFNPVYRSKDSNSLLHLNFRLAVGQPSDDKNRIMNIFLTQPPVRSITASGHFFTFVLPTARLPAQRKQEYFSKHWIQREDNGRLRYRDVVNYMRNQARRRGELGEEFETDFFRTKIYHLTGVGGKPLVLPRTPQWIQKRAATWTDDDAWEAYKKDHEKLWKRAAKKSRKRKRVAVTAEVEEDPEDEEEEAEG